MATTTITTTSPAKKRGKRLLAAKGADQADDPLATLRTLYPTAARAFLRRDVLLTQSLIDAAFAILDAHPLASTAPDAYASHRRKWDLLRITLETTLYDAPPDTRGSTAALDSLPAQLRSNLLLPAPSLLGTLHARSVRLYAPASSSTSAPAVLPSQILVALAFAALKLNCAEVARNMVEDWLARRSEGEVTLSVDGDATLHHSPEASGKADYERVLDAYCLHVLPRLGEWEYAMEFLQYETELREDKRKVCNPSVLSFGSIMTFGPFSKYTPLYAHSMHKR